MDLQTLQILFYWPQTCTQTPHTDGASSLQISRDAAGKPFSDNSLRLLVFSADNFSCHADGVFPAALLSCSCKNRVTAAGLLTGGGRGGGGG